MKQPVSSRTTRHPHGQAEHERSSQRSTRRRPRSVAIISPASEVDQEPDQPFVEGAQNAIDPDLRHRMISEGAYHRYEERGYADGYDVEDWLQAESEVDHVLINPRAQRGRRSAV